MAAEPSVFIRIRGTGAGREVIVCVRSGAAGQFFFVRRMLNQLGLPPVKRWQEKLGGGSLRSRRAGRLALGPEFHADVGFWRLMMSDEIARLGSHLSSRTLVSDASGTAVGGHCLETGTWWRLDLNRNAKSRLSEHVKRHNDLSINVLELLGMVVTAWALVVGPAQGRGLGARMC